MKGRRSGRAFFIADADFEKEGTPIKKSRCNGILMNDNEKNYL
jgi:hypothetical protein